MGVQASHSIGIKKARFAVNVEGSGGLRKRRVKSDNTGELSYAPCSEQIEFITKGGTL